MKKIFGISLIFLGIIFGGFFFNQKTNAQNEPPCLTKELYFDTGVASSNGTMPQNWYTDSLRPSFKVVYKTENCKGKIIRISLKEQDGLFDDFIPTFHELKVTVPESNVIEVVVKAGESKCATNDNPNCEIYIETKREVIGPNSVTYLVEHSKNNPNGFLKYNCDGACDTQFELVESTINEQLTGKWYFKTKEGHEHGPFTTKEECETTQQTFPESQQCYQKVTSVPTPPSGTGINPGDISVYDGNYTLLAPIPGLVPNNIVTSDFRLGDFVNNLIKIILGLAAVLAVIMIVFGGIEWMMSDSFMGKTAGRKRIGDALLGLGLALGSYLLLTTINPDLVNLNFGLEKQEIKILYEGDTNFGIPETGVACPAGINCVIPQAPSENLVYSIVSKLNGKTTYRFGGKGAPPPYIYDTKDCPPGGPCKTFCPAGTICLDCSGFVNFVLKYSGYKTFNGGTQLIFANAERVNSITNTSVNGTALKPGDLLGWTSGERHVIIYIGNGKVADSHGGEGRQAGKAVGIYDTTHFKDKIKFIKRAEPR